MQRWIILPDMQVPYHDKKSVAAVEKYMAAHKWDGYLNLGDFLDFAALSKYSKGKPGLVDKVDDIEFTFECGREILERQRKILGKSCRMVIIEGNHDHRVVSFSEEFPQLKKHLSVPKNLEFDRLGVEWIPFWTNKQKLFKLGNAYFHHGLYTGIYHARQHVERFGVCNYYGHVHDISQFPKVTHGNGKTLEAMSLGCLCTYDQQYLKGNPTNWQQAVSTLFLRPNGNYNLYVSRIFNHKFIGPDGVEYAP